MPNIAVLLALGGAAGACAGDPPETAELPMGARVRFATDPAAERWTSAIVAAVGNEAGECPMLAVPDSWADPQAYRLVRIDSISALAVSDRYDGLPGEDGRRRIVRPPPDTVGEGWTPVAVEAVRRRYGGCEPGLSGPP